MVKLKPGVSLCMIVKDEEQNLSRCLQSVKGLVDQVIVVDTGSTDRTTDIARQHGATVFYLPWPGDFSIARNFSLKKASCEWVFCLDADEELAADSRENFCQLLDTSQVEGYLMQIVNLVDTPSGREVLRHPSLRLWRNRPHYRFKGALHEEVLSSIQGSNPGSKLETVSLHIIHHGYTSRLKALKNKTARNLKILQAAWENDPADLYIRYNLGLEYWQLGDFPQAAKWLDQVYNECCREWPHTPTLLRNYAICLLELDKFTEALQVLQQGTAWFPTYTDLFYLEGMAYKSLSQPDKAIEALNHCLELGESPSCYVSTHGVGGYKACHLAGEILEHMEAHQEAVKAYTVALQHWSEYLPSLYGLARVLVKTGVPDQCISYLDQYFEFMTPRSIKAAIDALAAAGVAEGAVILARRALAKMPEAKETQLLLAQTYLLREREILKLAGQRFRQVPALERERQAVNLALERLIAMQAAMAHPGGEQNVSFNTQPVHDCQG